MGIDERSLRLYVSSGGNTAAEPTPGCGCITVRFTAFTLGCACMKLARSTATHSFSLIEV